MFWQHIPYQIYCPESDRFATGLCPYLTRLMPGSEFHRLKSVRFNLNIVFLNKFMPNSCPLPCWLSFFKFLYVRNLSGTLNLTFEENLFARILPVFHKLAYRLLDLCPFFARSALNSGSDYPHVSVFCPFCSELRLQTILKFQFLACLWTDKIAVFGCIFWQFYLKDLNCMNCHNISLFLIIQWK